MRKLLYVFFVILIPTSFIFWSENRWALLICLGISGLCTLIFWIINIIKSKQWKVRICWIMSMVFVIPFVLFTCTFVIDLKSKAFLKQHEADLLILMPILDSAQEWNEIHELFKPEYSGLTAEEKVKVKSIYEHLDCKAIWSSKKNISLNLNEGGTLKYYRKPPTSGVNMRHLKGNWYRAQ
jgi:hypothetical protein